MLLPYYTSESANWYALINKAQVAADYYFHPDVENYLVYVLAIMSGDPGFVKKITEDTHSNQLPTSRGKPYQNTRRIAEQSLVISGLFPDQAMNSGIPLTYFIDKGQEAYTRLSSAMPGERCFAFMSSHFTRAMDVLQVISEICGESHSIDLLQACELWQETRSKHSLSVIRSQIGKLPVYQNNDVRH